MSDEHDDRCESEYEIGAHAWTPCTCADRAPGARGQADETESEKHG